VAIALEADPVEVFRFWMETQRANDLDGYRHRPSRPPDHRIDQTGYGLTALDRIHPFHLF
jgi:hypothetical protein